MLVLTARVGEDELKERMLPLSTLWGKCIAAGLTNSVKDTPVPAAFPAYGTLKRDGDAQERYTLHAYLQTPTRDSFAYVYEYDDILALVVVGNAVSLSPYAHTLFGISPKSDPCDELFFTALSEESDVAVIQQMCSQLHISFPEAHIDFSAPLALPWGGRFFVNEQPGHLRAAIIGNPADEIPLARWLYQYKHSSPKPPALLLHQVYRAKLAYHEKVFQGNWVEIRAARSILDKRMALLLPHLNRAAAHSAPADAAMLIEAQRDAAHLALWESQMEALAVTLEISKEHLSERADAPSSVVPASNTPTDWFDAPLKTVTALLKQLDDERRYSQIRRTRFGYLTALVQSVQAERQQQQAERQQRQGELANELREVGIGWIGALTITLTVLQVIGNDDKAQKEPLHWPLVFLFTALSFSVPLILSRWKRHGGDIWNRLLSALPIGVIAWMALIFFHPHAPVWERAVVLMLPPLTVLLEWLGRRWRPTLKQNAAHDVHPAAVAQQNGRRAAPGMEAAPQSPPVSRQYRKEETEWRQQVTPPGKADR